MAPSLLPTWTGTVIPMNSKLIARSPHRKGQT